MKRFFALFLMLTLLSSCAVQAESIEYDLTFSDRELEGTWKESKAVEIVGSGSTCKIDGEGATLEGSTLILSDEGPYVLSGEFTDLLIVADVANDLKVQIVLNGANITSSNGPAIYIKSADKAFITLAEGTVNTVSDGSNYNMVDEETTLDAAIFSRDDLCINGKGTLNVTGYYKHGIVSKDDLVIVHATLNVEASSTALHGNDCVMMNGVSATLTAGSNGIRSDNAEDEGRGYIYFLDSTLTINAGSDGVQAEKLLRADNAMMTITTGGGSNSSLAASAGGGSDGGSGRGTTTTTEGSWKGLKSATDMELNGGAYVIDAADDALHTNGNLIITDGLFTLASGDDGIHADAHLYITGGDFVITKSYEGLEASKLEVAGGTFDVTASDDGMNAAGGVDNSGNENRQGGGSGGFSASRGEIIISGGYIHLNADGDGIDANGNITVTGGVTLVSGPTQSMNGAFDYDGKAHVSGGVLVAVGASGMAQSFSSAENQGCMLFNMKNAKANVNMAIVNADGQVMVSFTPEKSYASVALTAPGVQVGQTYYIIVGAEIEGADEFGFAQNTTYTGGSVAGTIEMTTTLQGGSGHSFGGGW